MLKIGLVQMRCEKGAINENLAAIAAILTEAAGRGIQIVGFPEMSLTGYANPHKFPQAVISLDGPEIGQLLALTQGLPLTTLVGLIEARPGAKPYITPLPCGMATYWAITANGPLRMKRSSGSPPASSTWTWDCRPNTYKEISLNPT
jgi:predicted amidohydrolase